MKNKKTKVCFVIPSLHAGGMERVMTHLIWYFNSREEIELHLILYGINRDVFYEIPKNMKIHKPQFTFDNTKRFLHTVATILFLRKKIREIHPDTVLSFGEIWNNIVILSCLGLKVPVYISDRCQPNKQLSFRQEWLRKVLYPKAKGIIVQTSTARDIYINKFKNKNIFVIGNPIRKIDSSISIPKENVVLSVGRLIHSKHFDELIKLFSRIGIPGWKLIIVGDDALKQQNRIKFEALIETLGARDRIELAGERSDVDSFYLRSKIFAFTSSSEGFPNVIGEAMSARLPVVSFDCIAGPSEMIQDGKNGFLVPLFNYTLFEEKLRSLMKNEFLQNKLGQQARSDIHTYYSVDTICKKFYTTIVDNENPAN